MAAAGGAVLTARSVPAAWVRPVVDSVSLPVHAATSPAYLPSAGAAAIVIARNGTANRFARLIDSVIPAAEAVVDTIIYVCVEPSSDGTKADAAVYEGVGSCSATSATSVYRWTGNGLEIPSTGNTLVLQGDTCASTGIQDLLERLGIVKNAVADGVITVDISSVENGAKGVVHVGADEYDFDVPPGACSPPTCCPP